MLVTLKFVPKRLFDQAENMSRATSDVLKTELITSVKKAAYLKYERKPSSNTILAVSQNLRPVLLSALPVMRAVNQVTRVVRSSSIMNSPPAR